MKMTHTVNMDLQIEKRKVSELKIYEKNPREHSAEEINKIASSMLDNQIWTNPMLIDEDNTIIAGHARREAALLIGLEEVPVIVLKGLTPAQKARICVSDNQLTLMGTWNEDLLREQLEFIMQEDNSIDIDSLGFDEEFLGKLDLAKEESELLDPLQGEKEEKAQSSLFLAFGPYRLHISQEELQGLIDAYEGYTKKNGVRYGFVSKVLLKDVSTRL